MSARAPRGSASRRRRAIAALALLGCGPAQAAELWRAPVGDTELVVEGSGFEKTAGTWVHLPGELVDATGELQRVFDETRALLPPGAAASLPKDLALPGDAGLLTETVRLQGAVRLGEDLELDVAWQPALVLVTDERFAGASAGLFGSASGALGGSAGSAVPQRRLVDFDPVLLDAGDAVIVHNLDKLALTWRNPAVTVVAGRQVVSWGTGHLWNPTDLFSPFAPTDVDREVRRGADALRVSVPLGAVSELEALWLPQLVPEDNGGVLRARTNLFGLDLSLTAAKYVGDVVLGADFAVDVDPFGVYGEGAWTFSLDGRDSFGRAVAGVEARPAEQWVVVVEGYYNGFGADSAEGIAEKLQNDRLVRGEVFGARRFYVGAVSSVAVTDLVSVSTTAILGLEDPGLLVVPALEWSVAQDVLVRAGATLPLGAGVDVAPFRALSPSDVVTDSPAFRRATTTLGARSEEGLTPVAAFVQLGVYFG